MKKLLLLLSLVVFPAAAFAGDVSLSAQVDKNSVALDDTVTLEVAVAGTGGSVGEPRLPAMPDFSVVSSGKSQSFSIINGKMSSSVSFRYILAPRGKGTFTIAPVTLAHEGKTYQTQPITVEVTSEGTAPRAAQREPGGRSDGRDYFVTASFDKASVYVNEPVVYTFRFYRAGQVLSQPQYQAPNFAGFWTEDTISREYTAVQNGRQYLVSELTTVVAPTKPGRFSPGSAALQVAVPDAQADSFGDDFFSGFFTSAKPRVLHTAPLQLTALPLPENGKPRDFTGAVGRYTVAAALDKASVRANEAVTLTVTVTGVGALKTLPAPILAEGPDIRAYDTSSSLNLRNGGREGSKIFKTVLVPLAEGPKVIGPVTYTFFDPAARAYRTVTAGPLRLSVKAAAPGSVPATVTPAAAAGAAPAVTRVQRDIRYIKTLDRWHAASGPLYRKPWFILLNLLPSAGIIGALLFARRRARLERDPAYARRRKASRTARAWLKQAERFLNGGTVETVRNHYAAIGRALREYIAHKTNRSAEGTTIADITALLEQRAAAADTAGRVKAVLEECDQVQFAPVEPPREAMEKIFAETGALITELEKQLK